MYQLTNSTSILREADGAFIPCDPANADYQQYLEWVAEGNTPEPYTEPALTVADFDNALTQHLDKTAQAKRYDNRITCALRAGYPGPFQAEGQAFAAWMDTCNAQAYALLAEVQSGTRPLPESTKALIDALPPMVWPA